MKRHVYSFLLFLSVSLSLMSCKDLEYIFSKKKPSNISGTAGSGSNPGAGHGNVPGTPTPPVSPPSAMVYLTSGRMRVGFNMYYGGAITYMSASHSAPNLINNFDLGRQLQYAYYSFPGETYRPSGKEPHPVWTGIGWDPIQTGDVYGNGSQVIERKENGNELYFKTIPKQWAYNNEPCECTVETWAKLTDNVLELRHVLQNNRTDNVEILGRGQELQVGYFTSKFHKVKTYWGLEPFTNAPLTEFNMENPPVPAASPETPYNIDSFNPEAWSYIHGEDGTGVGLFVPQTTLYSTRLVGRPNTGDEFSTNSGITGGNTYAVLDKKIRYESRAVIILGTVEETRSYAYAHKNELLKPDFDFSKDRQNFTFYERLDDGGYPFNGEWNIDFSKSITNLFGPYVAWRASEIPKLYFRMAYKGKATKTNVFWEISTPPYATGSETHSQTFDIIGDGVYRTYELDLSKNPNWRGIIRRVSLTPTVEYKAEEGQWMKIKYISSVKKE